VQQGVAQRLKQQGAMPKLTAALLRIDSEEMDVSRARRIELLDMNKDIDCRRWQVLYNDTARYEVISATEKTSAAGDYFIRVIYFEKGDNLPLYKSQQELREGDDQAEARRVLNSEDDEELNELFAGLSDDADD